MTKQSARDKTKSFRLSVIICTHNPRADYLARVIEALKKQTLPNNRWELLLIDNASQERLECAWDLTWHPNPRHLREDELGLTPARLRGITEAKGDILVFVDDDNVLSETYLAEALLIGERYSFLGAWGAGVVTPEFESPPPQWVLPYFPYLALREGSRVCWSNDVNDGAATPLGAGLCIRKFIADRYREELLTDALRVRLDRRGDSLDGAGDFDLVYTSNCFDLGWGTFPSLAVFHLIPSLRATKGYVLRIVEAAAASQVVLAAKTGRDMPARQGLLKRLVRGSLILARRGWMHLRIFIAHQRGTHRAHRQLLMR